RPARGAAADPREGARRARPFGAGEPPVSIEDAVAETSRSLAQSLNEEVSAHPARQEPRARQEPPARRQEPPARLEGQDARPAATQGASARDGAADVAPVRPNFIRPRHVTRKDMTRKDSSSQENGRVVEQTDPGGARPLIERVRAELDGATRSPASRRPLGPKATTDDVSAGDDPSTTPLRSGEVDGHASVARSRTSQARRKLLAEVRKVISPRRDAEAHEADPSVVSDREDGRALRYQASDAAAARQRSGAQDPPASEISSPEPLAQAPEALKTRLRADGPPRAPVAETIGAVPQLARPNALDLAAALAALPEVDHADEGLILLVGPSGSGKIATARALAERRAAGVTKAQRFDEPGAAPARPQHAKIDENGDRDDEPVFTVYWGEIRDAESAEAAARAAMGGALVIAALDAPNTAAAPPRLIELGLPPYALASSLRAVATQRLEERGCTRCAETGRDVRGEVCAECGGAGRIEIVEIGETLILDDATRALILSDAPEEAFQHAIAAARPQPTKRPPAPALERLLEIGASPRA
ncbi:MAG: ATPase, T2SS/T4P/T4SS family, partial [Pseudomonadota bacterium]